LPDLYRQLIDQLHQWITPQDQRHLQGVGEAVAAILQSESASLNQWLPYLSHRHCNARCHLARLSYLLSNRQVNAETFYIPLLHQFLQLGLRHLQQLRYLGKPFPPLPPLPPDNPPAASSRSAGLIRPATIETDRSHLSPCHPLRSDPNS
jgi:hypothetical protein